VDKMTRNISELSEEKVYKKIIWRIMPLAIFAYILTYFDRINISFAKTQMQNEIGLTDAAYGIAASMFFIGYVLFEVPSAIGLKKYGAVRWISRILISLGVVTSCLVFAYDQYTLYILRFLIGVMEAGFGPAVLFYLACWFPKKYLARINGLWFIAVPLSGAIGSPIAGLILNSLNGTLGMLGWHWLFIITGIPCIILGLVFLFVLSDKAEQAKWLNEEEKKLVIKNLELDKATRKNTSVSSWWRVLFTREVAIFSFIYFAIKSAAYGLNFWMPQIVEKSGIKDAFYIGLLTSLPYIVACIGMLVVTRMSDRTGNRKSYLLLCMLSAAIGYTMLCTLENNIYLMLFSLIVATSGSFIVIPIFWTLPQSKFEGIAVASGTAAINSLGQLSGMVAPIIIGFIAEHTGSHQLGLLSILPLLIISCIFITKTIKNPVLKLESSKA